MLSAKEYNGIRQFMMARTLAGHGLYYTAAYLVDGLMIDTGCAHTERELVAALEGEHLDRIVHTHSHEDHFGATGTLQERFGVPALIHPLGLPVLQAPAKRQPLRPYQRIMWGYPRPVDGQPLGAEIKTRNHHFQVIHTPGHCPDHVCLFEPDQGWLFTGDAFIGGKDRALRADYNIWQIIDSLKKLRDRGPRMMFPGSGSVRTEAEHDLAQKVDYLEETGQRVLELHRRGLSRKRIRQKVFGPEMAINYFTLGHFSGRQLVRSYIEDEPKSANSPRNQGS